MINHFINQYQENSISWAVFTALILLSNAGKSPIHAESDVDFESQIRPIFEQHCVQCHGSNNREGGLRLTSRRDAFTASDSGEPAIVAGKPEASLILERVQSNDESLVMPPVDEMDPLSTQEIQLLSKWIASGADWPKQESEPVHWAYIGPERPALPSVKHSDWPINAIDHFVLAKFESKELTPSQPEEKARLLRRASLALIGLPPTVEQVESFLADESPDAYERAVDQMLQSKRYGERWARQWLDLARYADSNGFQADQLRDSWAYRDWVIDALNENMPYDQFVVEQLAGDLLPDATVDQKIATGFHRTVTCNVEAGVHPEENRVNQVIDRVNTTATVFLGTTLECCQCHNHKYDPFTQTDYYKLFAYFNNTPLEVKLNSGVSYDFYGPKMDLPLDGDDQKRYDELKDKIAALNRKKELVSEASSELFDAWMKTTQSVLAHSPDWQPLSITSFESTGGEQFEILDDQSVLLKGKVPDRTISTITVSDLPSTVTAIRIDALTHDSLPGKGPGRGDPVRNNFILSELDVVHKTSDSKNEVTLFAAKADYSQPKWEVSKAIDGDRKTGWAIGQQFSKPHWSSFHLKQQLDCSAGDQLTFTLDQNYGSGRVLGRIRLSAYSSDPQFLDLPDNVVAILKTNKPSKKQLSTLRKYYDENQPEVRKLTAEIEQLQTEVDKLKPATTLVMVEMDESRLTNVMLRGDYLNPGSEVTVGTPEMLHQPDKSLPQNRLGLAHWLTSKDNPLIARVTVNRWWAEIFGQGIVATPEDFGTQSEPPTHPQLLDWLAVEFMDSGWDTKHIHKLLVMSQAFRQSARTTQQLQEIDPNNTLYARGPRFRLSAETIRDNGLAISGLLSTKMHGPPIMPYQPPGVWRQVGRNEPVWKDAKNEDRFRRGIYVVYRRAAPYPSFVNFDAPDRGACVAKRPRTNTPLQALTLLNDPAYVEMALSLAWHMMSDDTSRSNREKAIYGVRRCISREPTSEEVDHLLAVFTTELKQMQSQPEAANELIKGVEGFKVPKVDNPDELAAWFYVANVLLNLDETINR